MEAKIRVVTPTLASVTVSQGLRARAATDAVLVILDFQLLDANVSLIMISHQQILIVSTFQNVAFATVQPKFAIKKLDVVCVHLLVTALSVNFAIRTHGAGNCTKVAKIATVIKWDR